MLAGSVIFVTILAAILAAETPTCNNATSDDYIQHPEACNRYYRCVNGQIHDFSCAFGMHWSQEERRCVLEAQSTCRLRPHNIPDWPPLYQTTMAPPHTPPTAAPTCVPGVIVAWPDNHDCRRFYLCIEGDLWHMWCSPGTRFDYMSRRCDPNGVCVPGAVVGLFDEASK